jgi:hypothetical protein
MAVPRNSALRIGQHRLVPSREWLLGFKGAVTGVCGWKSGRLLLFDHQYSDWVVSAAFSTNNTPCIYGEELCAGWLACLRFNVSLSGIILAFFCFIGV